MDRQARSAAMVILTVLFVVFIVGMVYMIYSKPFEDMADKIGPKLDADAQPTFNKIMSVWRNWPIYTIITALIAGVVAIVWKREDSYSPPY